MTAPAHLAAAADALEAAGCQVDRGELAGLAWFTVALPFDDDVDELQVGVHPLIDGALLVSACRRYRVVPEWTESMRDVATLVASFHYWNDSVSSALEPMMEVAEDWLREPDPELG